MANLTHNLSRLLEQLNWMSALDILVVAMMFYMLLVIVRGTQAVNLLRGMIVLVLLVVVFSGLFQLRAVSWLLRGCWLYPLFSSLKSGERLPALGEPEAGSHFAVTRRKSSW